MVILNKKQKFRQKSELGNNSNLGDVSKQMIFKQ